jgi:hypothetical protein
MHFEYTRTNFLALIVNIGSLLYTLRTISNGLVLNLSNFSIDNKMMKILYSVDKLDQDGKPIKGKNAENKDGTDILKNNLLRREPF